MSLHKEKKETIDENFFFEEDSKSSCPSFGCNEPKEVVYRPRFAFLQRVLHFFLSVSLEYKIMGMALGVILFFGLFSTFSVYKILNQIMTDFYIEEGQSAVQELAYQVSESLLLQDFILVQKQLSHVVFNRHNIRFAVVLDHHNQVRAHTFEGGVPVSLQDYFLSLPHTIPEDIISLLYTNEGKIWCIFHQIPGYPGGCLGMGISESVIHRRVSLLLRVFLWLFVIVAIIGILVSALLTEIIVKPVNSLLRATIAIRNGDYNVRVSRFGNDEIGRLIDAFNEMVQELEQTEKIRAEKEQLRRGFLEGVILSQENERKRIALELHDQTAQSLASLMIGLKILEKAEGKENISKAVDHLRSVITKELDSIHSMARELRPRVLDDLGLIPAIEVFLGEFRKKISGNLQFHCIGFDHSRDSSQMETCLYRVIQESLTNIWKHANASSIQLILEKKQNMIRLVVEDDGIGFDLSLLKNTKRLGMYGMRERVELLQGVMTVNSEPEEGTMIVVEIPRRGE